MSNKIFRSIITTAALVLLASFVIIIGVLYGYGDETELKAYSPKYIVKSVNELSTLLCGGKAENK